MVNIKDIAKASNVSVATVSHVINKNYVVSKKLTNRVEKAIKELDFKPNLLAGSLRKKKTGTIGLVVPDSSNLMIAEIGRQVENLAYRQNYNVIVCNSSYNIDRENNNLEILQSKRVDGIIIIPETTSREIIDEIYRSGIPVVILERKINDTIADTVLVDNFKAGYEATKYLLDLGHRKIGYINRKFQKYHSIQRENGYIKALNEYNIKPNGDYIVSGDLSCESGFKAAELLLKQKNNVSAILAYGDFEAIGVIKAVLKNGLDVPGDISVIGSDDLPFCSYTSPELTTIHFPVKELVEKAMGILLPRINNIGMKKNILEVVSPYIVIRKSTSPLK
jgi:LacI family transcriptional regulator